MINSVTKLRNLSIALNYSVWLRFSVNSTRLTTFFASANFLMNKIFFLFRVVRMRIVLPSCQTGTATGTTCSMTWPAANLSPSCANSPNLSTSPLCLRTALTFQSLAFVIEKPYLNPLLFVIEKPYLQPLPFVCEQPSSSFQLCVSISLDILSTSTIVSARP